MKNINLPRMDNSGRSTEPSAPTGNAGTRDRNARAPQVVEEPQPIENWVCEFPGCGRVFTKKTGRGVHMRSAHRQWLDANRLEENVVKKDRWTDEERNMLARREAVLARRNPRCFFNIELQKLFPERSVPSIQGQRKRQDHKTKVREYAAIIGDEEDLVTSDETDQSDDAVEVEIQDEEASGLETYFADLQPLEGDAFKINTLNRICHDARHEDVDVILLRLAMYLREVFKQPGARENEPPRRNRLERPANDAIVSNSKRRRAEYARVQDLWRKNPSRCAKRILADQIEQAASIPMGRMYPYWRTVFTKVVNIVPLKRPADAEVRNLWDPIQGAEISRAFPPRSTAKGPDGVGVALLRTMPLEVLSRIFNLFMLCEQLPEDLCVSRTVLLAKKKDAVEPGDYRPITVSSVITRTFHKVLANRMKKVHLDERQRGFRELDGCAENVFLLDLALKFHQKKCKSMYMASLDMAKAFDSVTFDALEEVMKAKGVPRKMVTYIMRMYQRSNTILQHGGATSAKIRPTCGVKQGDPLSPVLFNFIIDEFLRRVPEEIGVDIDGLRLNVIAFADDLLLMARTRVGLQQLIDTTTEVLATYGLAANPRKCSTTALRAVAKQKYTAVDGGCRFKIGDVEIPALQALDEWKYLGIRFTSKGRTISEIFDTFKGKMETIARAPLKPQQRLWALRVCIIPAMLHELTLGSVTISLLRRIDILIRRSVRGWLRLPADCPNAYFHACAEDGGLSIPSTRWRSPLDRRLRLQKLLTTYEGKGQAETFLQEEIAITERRLDDSGVTCDTRLAMRKRWATLLYASVDGKGLSKSGQVAGQNSWITENTRFLTGADYVKSCRLRINALPTRSRTARGRDKDRTCRGGCGVPETLNHVLQQCHRTHDIRCQRHNAINNYLRRILQQKGYTVVQEHRFLTTEGWRKPDIVATSGTKSIILDSQVVGDQVDLKKANKDKIKYYAENLSLADKIKDKFKSEEVVTVAATLNWRGIWSRNSINDLVTQKIIRAKDVKVISSRVIIGGISEWNVFNMVTTCRRPRQGVG